MNDGCISMSFRRQHIFRLKTGSLKVDANCYQKELGGLFYQMLDHVHVLQPPPFLLLWSVNQPGTIQRYIELRYRRLAIFSEIIVYRHTMVVVANLL